MDTGEMAPEDLLRERVGGDWTAPPAQAGAVGSSYLATSGDRRLFLKIPAALHAYDGGARPIRRDTIEWWAARASLRVALWLDAHGRDPGMVRSFLADFLAAESGAPNPKMLTGTERPS